MQSDAVIFSLLRDALHSCEGEKEAYTLQGLAEYCGCSRRMVERVLEARLEDLGFVVVSGTSGYWRPETAEEINHYLASLQSRCIKVFLRKKRITRLAASSGFIRCGKTFENPPSRQQEFLFSPSTITHHLSAITPEAT